MATAARGLLSISMSRKLEGLSHAGRLDPQAGTDESTQTQAK